MGRAGACAQSRCAGPAYAVLPEWPHSNVIVHNAASRDTSILHTMTRRQQPASQVETQCIAKNKLHQLCTGCMRGHVCQPQAACCIAVWLLQLQQLTDNCARCCHCCCSGATLSALLPLLPQRPPLQPSCGLLGCLGVRTCGHWGQPERHILSAKTIALQAPRHYNRWDMRPYPLEGTSRTSTSRYPATASKRQASERYLLQLVLLMTLKQYQRIFSRSFYLSIMTIRCNPRYTMPDGSRHT